MDPLIGGVSQDIVEVYDPGIPPLQANAQVLGGVPQVNVVPGGNVSGTQTATPTLTGGVSATADAGGNTFNQTYAPVQTYAPDNRNINFAPPGFAPLESSNFAPGPALPSMQMNPMAPITPMQTQPLQSPVPGINIPPMSAFRGPQPQQAAPVGPGQLGGPSPTQRQVQIGGRAYNAQDVLAQAPRDQGVPDIMSDAANYAGVPVAPQRPMFTPPQQAQMDYAPPPVPSYNQRPLVEPGAIQAIRNITPQIRDMNNPVRDAVREQAWQMVNTPMPAPLDHRGMYRAGLISGSQRQQNAYIYQNQRAMSQQALANQRAGLAALTSLSTAQASDNRSQATIDAQMLRHFAKQPTADAVVSAQRYMDQTWPDPEDPEQLRGRLGWAKKMRDQFRIDLYDLVNQPATKQVAMLQGKQTANYIADNTKEAKVRLANANADKAELTRDFLKSTLEDRKKYEALKTQYKALENQYGPQLFPLMIKGRLSGLDQDYNRLRKQNVDAAQDIVDRFMRLNKEIGDQTEGLAFIPKGTDANPSKEYQIAVSARDSLRAEKAALGAVGKDGLPQTVSEAIKFIRDNSEEVAAQKAKK